MNLQIEWRVAPEHVSLLPATGQVPNISTAPALGDLIQLADRRNWVVVARTWEPWGLNWKLVVQIAPDTFERGQGLHTLH